MESLYHELSFCLKKTFRMRVKNNIWTRSWSGFFNSIILIFADSETLVWTKFFQISLNDIQENNDFALLSLALHRFEFKRRKAWHPSSIIPLVSGSDNILWGKKLRKKIRSNRRMRYDILDFLLLEGIWFEFSSHASEVLHRRDYWSKLQRTHVKNQHNKKLVDWLSSIYQKTHQMVLTSLTRNATLWNFILNFI